MVSVSLKERQSEQTRFDKINVVSNYINEHLDVGDVDNPQTYFKGTIPMRWTVLKERGGGALQALENEDTRYLVFFTGKTYHTIFGLGGSPQHIIGEQMSHQNRWYPQFSSHTPRILDMLLTTLGKLDPASNFLIPGQKRIVLSQKDFG